ncbi:MAG: hypothetical protein J6U97_04675 [Bacteroidaceae bacterium]|nr:hypothetical protein [Bacteroidaceae bacterium]
MAKKKNTVKIKTASVNKALSAMKEYTANVASGAELNYDPFNEALSELKQFLNKDGTVSKSKTRSKKAKAALNEAAANVLDLGSSKRKRKRNKKNYQIGQAADVLSQKKFSGDMSAASTAAQVFYSKTWDKISKNINSDFIITLSEAGFNMNQIFDIAKYMNKEIEKKRPEELKKFVSEDEASLFVSHVANLHELFPEMTADDAIAIADRMTEYGFDNYEYEASQWGYPKQ